jgi:hypothetical protein
LGQQTAVVVPKPGVVSDIKPGSGIVAYGHKTIEGMLVLYYEGNLLEAENLSSWQDRVSHAFGRMVQNYPTVATALAPIKEFQIVGSISDYGIVHCTDPAAVERWSGETPVLGPNLTELEINRRGRDAARKAMRRP